jgi:hypothetical protein
LLQIQGNKIHDNQFEIRAEHQTPDQEFTTRLAVLMYPLLDPASETYWQHILASLEQRSETRYHKPCESESRHMLTSSPISVLSQFSSTASSLTRNESTYN